MQTKSAQDHSKLESQIKGQFSGGEARYYQNNDKKWDDMTMLEKAKNHWSSYII